jgi:hypothetical protein
MARRPLLDGALVPAPLTPRSSADTLVRVDGEDAARLWVLLAGLAAAHVSGGSACPAIGHLRRSPPGYAATPARRGEAADGP